MVTTTQNHSSMSQFTHRNASQTAAPKTANTTSTTKSRPSFLSVLLRSLASFAA